MPLRPPLAWKTEAEPTGEGRGILWGAGATRGAASFLSISIQTGSTPVD